MAKSLPWWGVAAFLLVAMDFDNIDIEDVIGASGTERGVEPEFFEETARRLAEEGWYRPDPDEFDFSATSPPSEFHSTTQSSGILSEDGEQIVEGTTNLTVKKVKLMRHGSLVLPFQAPAQILANHSLQVTVPCLDFFTFQLITPCGNLTLPREGITFSTAFGKYTMPGADFLQSSLRKTERELSQYTVLFIVLSIAGWFCYTFLIKSNRERFFDKMREICSGRLIYHDHEDDDDDDEDPKNPLHHDEQRARLDPMSPEFIAPGNIYRLLAVLHPGIIGFRAWGGYAFRAAIVAYMQLWMPFQIITNTFKRWHWLGIKSPLWFLANAGTFVAMVTALGSLCGMFAARCTHHIYRGAEANMYILSHYNPMENDSKRSSLRSSVSSQQAPLHLDHLDHLEASIPSLPGGASSLQRMARVAGVQETLDGASTTVNEGIGAAAGTVNKGIDTVNKGINQAYATYSRIEKPAFSRWAIDTNEFIWCNVAMGLNVLMSVMLEFCMFLKVATYTGRIGNVAMTAVSLYFIFDLDDRVMEADPKLRQKYRRAVAAQTEPKLKEQHPWMIPTIASLSAAFVNLTVPLGLIGIVLIAWKREKDGFVIGGDGLTTV
ncbi:unnamed protein product [Symbiodinium sp. CCMP2456]|nr:unnamed protein product [Symbiodinium sp. CCMP2456]